MDAMEGLVVSTIWTKTSGLLAANKNFKTIDEDIGMTYRLSADKKLALYQSVQWVWKGFRKLSGSREALQESKISLNGMFYGKCEGTEGLSWRNSGE